MKLSKLLSNNLPKINNCKTSESLYRTVNSIINKEKLEKKDEKYAGILQKCLKNCKDYNKSLQYVYNCIVSGEGMAMKKDTITKNNWFKGTAIHGMECSGH